MRKKKRTRCCRHRAEVRHIILKQRQRNDITHQQKAVEAQGVVETLTQWTYRVSDSTTGLEYCIFSPHTHTHAHTVSLYWFHLLQLQLLGNNVILLLPGNASSLEDEKCFIVFSANYSHCLKVPASE